MVVLLGAGGSGRTTIANKLIELGFKKEITYTTRTSRTGETDGIHYHFIQKDKFNELYTEGQLATKTIINNNFYGIHKQYLCNDCVIVTDLTTLNELKKWKNLDIVSIYIKVSREEREKRMIKRGDRYEDILSKLQNNDICAESEEAAADYVVENNNIEVALANIKNILSKGVM